MADTNGKNLFSAETAGLGRRDFLSRAGLVGASVAVAALPGASAQTTRGSGRLPSAALSSQRKLGTLTVSSLGLGVQNMSRKFNTLTPYRPEMVSLIRAAHDQGVTFFDTAEAYEPLECERILGESIRLFATA